MKKKELINKITDYSSDLMDKHFPKGECKERGRALVFNADMILYISDLFGQELDKAREEGRKEGIEYAVRLIKDNKRLKEWLETNDIEGIVKNGDVIETGKKYATTINLN